MSEEKIDVTQEVVAIDNALDRLQTGRSEHHQLVAHLNRIILAVNSKDGFCKMKEPSEQ